MLNVADFFLVVLNILIFYYNELVSHLNQAKVFLFPSFKNCTALHCKSYRLAASRFGLLVTLPLSCFWSDSLVICSLIGQHDYGSGGAGKSKK
jgi:hypothetical protein